MTPQEAALLAQRAYTEHTLGIADSASRALVVGDAVAFPGTDNPACWLADLDARVIAVPGMGYAHEGFWKAWQNLSDEILWLKPRILIGHSLGAAIAILAAGALCVAGTPPNAVYGFEPPRVSTDDTLGRLLARVSVMLYRNGNDVVPMIPRIIHDWQHPVALTAIGTPILPVPNIEDHYMERILNAL
jgi:hypothetical protein